MYRMSGIIHRNIALMRVSFAVIPIMASLNAPSLSTKIGSIRPRPNSPRMEAVVEAGGRGGQDSGGGSAGLGRGDAGNW